MILRKSKRGQAQTIVGIACIWIILNIVAIYFYANIGSTIIENRYTLDGGMISDDVTENCDCGVLTCNELSVIRGQTYVNELCLNQVRDANFGFSILATIGEFPILTAIWFFMNALLIVLMIAFAIHGNG